MPAHTGTARHLRGRAMQADAMTSDDLSARILEALIEAGQKIQAACQQYAAEQIRLALIPAPGEKRGEPASGVADAST